MLLLLLLVAAALTSPADELRAAQVDVTQLPPEVRPTTRYLSLYAIDPKLRAESINAISYVLNALSRTRAITRPQPISATLLRFNLGQYTTSSDELTAWSAAWEQLAQSDPYFHLQTEVLAPSSPIHPFTRSLIHSQITASANSAFPLPPSALKTLTTDGGWLDLAAAAQLRAATGSIGAVLRADYFVAQATIPPAYYAFSGIPDNENDFLKSLGVDREAIQRLRADAGANLIISGVTAKPRRIVWSQGPLGGVYSTLDVDHVDAQRDPIRRPITTILPLPRGEGRVRSDSPWRGEGAPFSRDAKAAVAERVPATDRATNTATFALKYEVSEWFALAPNGLWRTALFNAAGKRQDSVPDRVAKDTSDPQGDGIVVPMLSCIRCHRESGLRPFTDDQSRLLSLPLPLPRGEGRGEGAPFSRDAKAAVAERAAANGPRPNETLHIDLLSPDAAIAQRAAEFYDEPRLQRQIQFDRQTYADAVARCTGGTKPDQLADSLAAINRNFAYLPVTTQHCPLPTAHCPLPSQCPLLRSVSSNFRPSGLSSAVLTDEVSRFPNTNIKIPNANITSPHHKFTLIPSE